MAIKIEGGWLNGNCIRRARKRYRCDNTRGVPEEKRGPCLIWIEIGDQYAEGEVDPYRAGGFGHDRHCMECAGVEAKAALAESPSA